MLGKQNKLFVDINNDSSCQIILTVSVFGLSSLVNSLSSGRSSYNEVLPCGINLKKESANSLRHEFPEVSYELASHEVFLIDHHVYIDTSHFRDTTYI